MARTAQKVKKSSILDSLTKEEAATLLQQLLKAHPELRIEAESLAQTLLNDSTFQDYAIMVEDAILALDEDQFEGRAGRHRHGYTDPGDAAVQMIDEALQPFEDNIKRLLEIGALEQAVEVCRGILLGLHNVSKIKDHEVLRWAPDFATEAAWSIARAFRKSSNRSAITSVFAKEWLPEWKTLVRDS